MCSSDLTPNPKPQTPNPSIDILPDSTHIAIYCMLEDQDRSYELSVVNAIAADMHSGVHPDIDFEMLANGKPDSRRLHVVRQYLRRDLDGRMQHFEFVQSMLTASVQSDEDETSLIVALESIYHLPYRSISVILRQLNAEICNSLTSTCRSKYVVEIVVI